MLPLADDSEPRLLKCSDRIQVVDTGELGHELDRYLDLPHFRFSKSLFDCLQVLLNCLPDILKRFPILSVLVTSIRARRDTKHCNLFQKLAKRLCIS